jgi:hypothetical protein
MSTIGGGNPGGNDVGRPPTIVKPNENTLEKDASSGNRYDINGPGSYLVNLRDGGGGDSLFLSALSDVTATVNTDEGDVIELKGFTLVSTEADGSKKYTKGNSTVVVSGEGTVKTDDPNSKSIPG